VRQLCVFGTDSDAAARYDGGPRSPASVAKPQVVVNLAALTTVAETIRYESLIEKDDPLVALAAMGPFESSGQS
jgi:hypothetical protein